MDNRWTRLRNEVGSDAAGLLHPGAIPHHEKGQLKMRPFTICYGLMFLALGAVTCYGIANVDDLRDPFHDMRTFTLPPKGETQSLTLRAPETASSAEKADTCCAAVVAPAQTAASTEAAATDAELTVVAGMTSDEVRALLGEPEDVSSDGARWTYGSSVLIFSD